MFEKLVDATVRSRAARDLAAQLLNATIPRGFRVTRDLAYGPDPHHKLDLYVPKAMTAPLPVVLYIYGGGWQFGTKATYAFLAEALTSAGIMVAVADYRLYPQVKYPAFLEDGAMAFRFLHKDVGARGGDPNRLFLAGHSAGAYNAVMLAADRRYLSDDEQRALKGVIGVAGLYDFLPLTSEAMIAIFGGDNVKESQPIEYVDRKLAPMLLATGTKDAVVNPRNSQNMAKKLRAFGSDVELREFEDIGHFDIIVSLARGFRGRTSLRQDIVNFIHER